MNPKKVDSSFAPTPLWQHLIRGKSGDIILAVALILGGIFLFMWGTGSYDLWDPWEPKYGQAMREMMARDDFITPYYEDRIRWTKPILIYWAMYVPIRIGGNNAFTVRLPSVIAAIAGVLFTFYFLKKLRGRRTAILAACILGTIPQYFYMARQAMPDMLLTLFLCTAMGFLALARFGREHNKRYFMLFYASVAFAFLAKGPVACVLILGAVLIFWMISIDPQRLFSLKTVFSDIKTVFKSYHMALGLIIFLAIGSPWYIAMLIKHGSNFIDTFIMYENISRFKEPIRGHHGIANYYIRTLFHGMYPWSSLLPVGILFYFHGPMDDREKKQRWYYLSWFLSMFLLFTTAGTKQQHYILPMTPVVAILIAMVWEKYFQKNTPFWIPLVFLISIAFVFQPIRDFLIEGNRYIFDNFTNRNTIDHIYVRTFLKLMFAAWATVMVLSIFFRRSRLMVTLAILIAYGNGIFFCHYVMPEHTKTRTVRHFLEYYLKRKDPDTQLIFYGKIRPSINYYYGKDKYHHFEKREEKKLAAFVGDEKKVYIIAEKKYARRLLRQLRQRTPFKWQTISREHPRYQLISNTPTLPMPVVPP